MKYSLKNLFTQFTKYRPLIHELVVRDLRVKYRRSFLGYVWSLLNPLLMMCVMTLVFSYMFRFDIPNYPLYLICGQTLYSFFNESTSMAMYSIMDNGSLIKKVYIPKYIFPVSRVVSSFVTMSFSLASILIVMLFTRSPFHWTILLFPIPLLSLLIFCIGIALVLSAIAVQFRDVTHLYGVITLAWMYLTPIFYPLSAIPDELAPIIECNPLYNYITFFRELVLYGRIPQSGIWLPCAVASMIAFVIGVAVFRKLQRNFILYI